MSESINIMIKSSKAGMYSVYDVYIYIYTVYMYDQ